MTPATPRQPRLVALRYRDFRLLWSGEMFSTIGSQMQLYAINWHIARLLVGQTVTVGDGTLDAQALGLGLLGLVNVIPIVLFALVGGMLADTFDRRKLMIGTRLIAGALAVILAVLTVTGQATVQVIYLITALAAGVTAFDSPARQSLVPNLVNREHLGNAVSLNNLMRQVGTILGPALTGLLIGAASSIDTASSQVSPAELNTHIGIIYAINAITFLIAALTVILLQYRGAARVNTGGIGLEPLKEGLRFTYSSRIIWGTMLLDFFATFFSSARTMLPLIATNILGLDAAGYGLLATGQAVGSLIAGGVIALGRDIYHQGRVLLISVAIYGLATVFFGLSTTFIPAYIAFALTGAGDTVSTVIRGTIRQILTPDHLRGRMTSVNMIFFMGGPQLGELEAGLVASAWGVPFAIVSGGVITVLMTGWIAWNYPRLRRYTSDMSAAAVS
ncbi:MAG: MFS transporter [Anaerolineaceae bacterium]|nr:MFS transporter [Anaerolineaceae bacterium]